MMKPSRYNRWIGLPDSARLLFNSRSAALVQIEPGLVSVIERLLVRPASAANPVEEEFVRGLVYGKFLVEEDADEVGQLKTLNRRRRFVDGTLFLTIAPTLACNFACQYCYESTGGRSIDPATEEKLLAFADEKLRRSPNMLVTWFGGEPTLCLPTVLRIQSRLREAAESRGVRVEDAAIITNGYRLDATAAGQLAGVGITSAQVTLDGPPETHDRRRPLRNGGGTFRRILDNLTEAANSLRITVRINIDRSSLAEACDVMAELDRAGLLSRLAVYFAPVEPADGVCADVVGRCFSSEEFAAAQVFLYQSLLEAGYNCIDYPTLSPGGHCGADSANAWVVAPNGLLFKCWEELSLRPDKSVGDLHADVVTPQQRANLDRYLAWDPFEKPGCVDCDILPVCMGGCPIDGLKRNSQDAGVCSSWKFNLGDMLKLRYLLENRKEVKQ